MTSPISQSVDTLAGRTSTGPFITVNFPRSPTVRDMNYKTGQRWIDTSAQNAEWYLLNFLAAEGVVNANWVQLGSGSNTAETVSGNTGDVVSGNVNNNIFILGNEPSGITTDGDLSNTLTLSLENIPNSSLTNSSITLIAGAGISITNSPVSLGGSTTISATSPTSPVLTLSDDVSASISPTAGNIQLVGHVNEQGGAKFSTVVAGSSLANINPMSSTRWIVDPLGFNGTHTTITAATAAATSGDTILIMDGTYTENITIKDGVNYFSYGSFPSSPNYSKSTVTWIGRLTDGGASASITSVGIVFVTNGNYVSDVSGGSTMSFVSCQFVGSNFTLFNVNGSLSNISLRGCTGSITGPTATLFNVNNGLLQIADCKFINSGVSTTPSVVSGGTAQISWSEVDCPISTTTTGAFNSIHSIISTSATNTTCVTLSGTSTAGIVSSQLSPGSAAALNIGSGTVATVTNCTVSSSATNVFTGAGTINTAGNACTSSSGNNVSTINHLTVI